MVKKNEYRLEVALEKLFLEGASFIKKAGNFLFTIPKKKIDKMIYIMDILAWTFLTIALVLRIFNY